MDRDEVFFVGDVVRLSDEDPEYPSAAGIVREVDGECIRLELYEHNNVTIDVTAEEIVGIVTRHQLSQYFTKRQVTSG